MIDRSRRLIVLGSTGSIGVNTLDVVEHLAALGLARFDVVGLAAGSNLELLRAQAKRFGAHGIAIADGESTGGCPGVEHSFCGSGAARELVAAIAQAGDLVVGAISGAAGLPAIIEAIDRGCDIALANKETLVAAGALVMPRARERGVAILPIDSEHSAIAQCMRSGRAPAEVRRIVLTASGGPFRNRQAWPAERIAAATVEEALNHPTWEMGRKVTIDSASMMNKALEIIEAHWLFDLPPEKIEVLVHPQSLVHGLVEFIDGSVVAQLAPPDMRTPIQCALTWPHHVAGAGTPLDWDRLRSLVFEPVDRERFPAVDLAWEALRRGGSAGAILNGANEEAVAAFLGGRIPFGRIVESVAEALDGVPVTDLHNLDDVFAADREARAFVAARVPSAALRVETLS